MGGRKSKTKEAHKKTKHKKKRKRTSSSSPSSSASLHSALPLGQGVAQWPMLWGRGWPGMWPQMPGQMFPGANGWPTAMTPPGGCPGGAPMWPAAFGGGASSSRPGPSSTLAEEKAEKEEDIPIFLDRGVEESVPVPRALIGKVVGKRGSTIAEVRASSGAWKVDATDQSSDPVMIKVCGTADAVKKARKIINELVENPFEKHADSDYVEISQGKIGRIIGPKGAQVNEIEKQTGTKIDIDYEREPCKVYIQGSAEAVKIAKQVMEQICKEK